MAASRQNHPNQNSGRILIVGSISKAFLNPASLSKAMAPGTEIFEELSEAIEAVSKDDFSVIAIVMSGIHTGLDSAIRIFRDKSSARIVLLAQMYEEPIAIRLAGSSYNDKPLVDDYMICPVQADRFRASCIGPRDSALPQAKVISDDLESRIRHLEKLATEDDLTGLKNRRYIREFTKQIIEYARKQNGRVTLLLFDIDDFKKYNDVYGHAAGDEILKQAAHLMQRCCRAHDVVGRIGGDEFAVVFWDDPSILKAGKEHSERHERRSIDSDHPHEAMLIANRFIGELEKTPSPLANPNETSLGPAGVGTLTISGGLASCPRDASTAEELFEQADKALLAAKHSGKNRIYLVGKP
ncbi:MAG: GGDEF domain-containing protein [Sedimentisphaerales bacterium]